MKNIYILLALLFVLAGCTGFIDEPNKYDKDCIVLNIVNGPMTTKATNEGTEYERMINRLDCFFYVKDTLDKCVYYQKITNNSTVIGRQEIPFYVDESVINRIFPDGKTTCDVFVIANYPGSNDWTTTYKNTSVDSLKRIVLDLFEKETDGTYKHDAVGKPFVMAGFNIANKGDKNNASGEIQLVRAASKITLQVKIPEWIDVKEVTGDNTSTGTNTTVSTVRYYPHLTNDSDGKVPLRTAFHNGVSKTYLSEGENYNSLLEEGDYFSTDLKTYSTPEFEDGETEDKAGYHTCQLEVPFYSYARSWAKGDVDAPYLTLQMPWKKTEDGTDFNTYYYQIMVNAGGLKLSPNSWYDLTVNVGVLGSLTPSVPTEIKSDDITYYILDWTKEPSQDEGDRYEDIVIKEYAYLQVPEKEIVINNSSVGYIPYDASHTISWEMNTTGSKTCDILPDKDVDVDMSSFYVYCRNGAEIKDDLLKITKSNFSLDPEKPGYLKYEYEIPENVYSPVYVYVTITMTVGGKKFSEDVRIVQYPPIYIVPDASVAKSVYVNNNRASSTNVSYHEVQLGKVSGGDDGNYMYTINVSSFKEGDTFTIDGTTYNYIIGDPRQTEYNNYKLHSGFDFTDDWVTAPATYENSEYVNNSWTNTRILTYYQPTSTDPNVINVIAPKFRIVSFNSTVGGDDQVARAGGPLRCATYQEDGFPAGRWRVPTAAEIFFIANLQADEVIVNIFQTGTQKYYCSTGMVSVNNGNPQYYEQSDVGTIRCVYDEWYWGSEREAKRNPAVTSDRDATSYLFTWGDEPRR